MKWLGLAAAVSAIFTFTGCKGQMMVFDRGAWAAERGNMEGESRRAGMVAGLEAAGLKAGASRASVRELLGEPDMQNATQDRYYLGRAGFGIDLEQLRIDYDADGRVSGTVIERS